MLEKIVRTGLTALCLTALAAPASAQVVQSVQFGVGGFFPRGIDSRVPQDVLAADQQFLTFDLSSFKTFEVSGEWNVGFGDHLEATFGAAFSQRHVNSFYTAVTFPTGDNITQQLGLRMIPLTAGIRFLPIGKAGKFQPYVGAGIAAISWRYSEAGDFVDPDSNIFSGRYTSTGVAVGPVVFAGFKAPLAGDIYAFTMEFRYQHAAGTLDASQQFAGSQIDLGGLSTRFGLQIRF